MPTTRLRTLSQLEPLESRIAPASITFTDIDGVTVTITASKGTVADLQSVAILVDEGLGQELRELDLAAKADIYQGANISIVKGTLSDSQFVNIGFIDATGLDLGKVTVDGDLGRIVAGDLNSATPAAKDLTVGSIGVQGLATQDGGSLVSKFIGRLSSLSVNGDFKDASITVLGVDPDPDENVSTDLDARGDIGNIFIGGDLIGGGDARTGYIYSKGSIGNITIVGSVLGGSGDFSASITSERNMGKVDVGGDVRGGVINGGAVSDFSGRIFSAGGMGSVRVGGELRGGDGAESGNISSAGVLGNVTIEKGIFGGLGRASGAVGTGGDIGKITVLFGGVNGGEGPTSGSILAGGDMKAVKVTGDIAGGAGFKSGVIAASGNVASALVEGSVIGGGGEASGAIGSALNLGAVTLTGDLKGGAGDSSGAIGCFGKLGPISIGGDFVGGSNSGAGRIAAGVSIAKITIGDAFEGGTANEAGSILAAKIGSVSIGGGMTGGTGTRTAIIAGDSIAKVSIVGDLKGNDGPNSGSILATRALGDVSITGSLIGGSGFFSGIISAQAFSGGGKSGPLGSPDEIRESIGNVKILGSIQGGSDFGSGAIISDGTIASVNVGVDVAGGTTSNTGMILAQDNIGTVKIGRDLVGDVESGNSGRIRTFGKLGSVTIGRDLIGGGGFYGDSTEGLSVDGQIASGGPLGTVVIAGNVIGGGGNNSAMINGGSIKSVLIKGNVEQGFGFKSASVIASQGNLTSLTVKGAVNLVDNSSNESFNRIVFGAADSIGSATFGALNGTGDFFTEGDITAVNTIGKVTVVDSAKYFKILAGYNTDAQPVKSESKINKVVIGTTGEGNIQGVDIVAGVMSGDFSGMGDNQFGTSDDTPIFPFRSDAVSRIASVVIKGNIIPSTEFSGHNGIVAGQIDFVKVNGTAVKLTKGLDVIELGGSSGPGPVVLGIQSGFTVREVSFAQSQPSQGF